MDLVFVEFEVRRRDLDDVVVADDAEAPLDIAIGNESSEVLAEGLKKLSERDRTILIERYYFEKSFREIGDMLDMTEANARVASGRALKKLKELIGDRLS